MYRGRSQVSRRQQSILNTNVSLGRLCIKLVLLTVFVLLQTRAFAAPTVLRLSLQDGWAVEDAGKATERMVTLQSQTAVESPSEHKETRLEASESQVSAVSQMNREAHVTETSETTAYPNNPIETFSVLTRKDDNHSLISPTSIPSTPAWSHTHDSNDTTVISLSTMKPPSVINSSLTFIGLRNIMSLQTYPPNSSFPLSRSCVSHTLDPISPGPTNEPPHPLYCSVGVFPRFNQSKGYISTYEQTMSCGSTWIIKAREGYGLIVEFHQIDIKENDLLQIYSHTWNHTELWFLSRKSKDWFVPRMTKGSLEIVFAVVKDKERKQRSNFYLSYIAHPIVDIPNVMKQNLNEIKQLESIFLYVCDQITNLPDVIMCDGIHHCVRGEDEKHCPHRNKGCGEWFPFGNNCFKANFVPLKGRLTARSFDTVPVQAAAACQSEYGASLAKLQYPGALTFALRMVRNSGFRTAVVGLKKVKPVTRSLRHLYRFLWQWGDEGSSIAYDQLHLQRSGTKFDCVVLDLMLNYSENKITTPVHFKPLACALPDIIPDGYICMKPNPRAEITGSRSKTTLSGLSLPRQSTRLGKFPTKQCSDGSVVQVFHRCGWGIEDTKDSTGWSPSNLPLFQCSYGQAVHYSLLCDGNDDCLDRSDEINCQKPQFPPILNSSFICRNMQPVASDKRCDGKYDCFDESDEESCISCRVQVACPGFGCMPHSYAPYIDSCPEVSTFFRDPLFLYPHAAVKLDGYGMSVVEYVHGDCKEGFYPCEGGFCIPTYLLNNGEQDCRRGEDEGIPVRNLTCPGYYRCLGVGSCVHSEYVCDGVYHCPYKDDEMFCQLTCPHDDGCTCEGYALTCSKMIDPIRHLYVRYLDLSLVSNVFLDNIHFMEYLFYLNLSSCHLGNVTLVNMPHLQVLDISFNSLRGLAYMKLNKLPGLVYLKMSNNPLLRTINSAFSTLLSVGELHNLKTLIMTSVSLGKIEGKAFISLSKLKYLDLRANSIHTVHRDSLFGLTALEEFHTDEFKLCCSYFLRSSLPKCHAPVDELSSCSDLLAQDFFRVFLWLLSALAVVGNSGVFICRVCLQRNDKSSAHLTLVKNLCAADLLMGVYMMMIGVADVMFHGEYVAKEMEWRNSTMCTVAGFVSFVSSEASALIICLITLDRVLVIGFPFKKHIHFSEWFTRCACLGIWVAVIFLAAVPLLVTMEFYGQNSICIPLPITRKRFSGQTYAFAIFLVLNFIIFILIGLGQLFIFHTVRRTSVASRTDRRQQELTIARRLFLIVFTDFCCWFPIGVVGLTASRGTPIPAVVNVWVAIFALPLNSALNPFLYTLNGLMEQWKKRRMEQRAKKILCDLRTEIPKWNPANVKDLMIVCIRTNAVEKETLWRMFGFDAGSIRNDFSCDEQTDEHVGSGTEQTQ